ncbi:unnamed protein product [Spirodela intermedia]|uniref:Uncharacterized protein n=1 Tax=Spirodela intermedia TaxID=51605 RepID=A0A7I8IK03_SPIIN|nr:unnamed protein product [Spirodela intermedia]CAA6658211.1 unnamed protein product [Spirodela intermedia]
MGCAHPDTPERGRATVKVTCKAGDKHILAFGKTRSTGVYSIIVKGYDYVKYGAANCKAQLHAGPNGSLCNVATDINRGNKGAKLHVKSTSNRLIVLKTKSFAYAPKKQYKECHKHHSPPPPSPSPPLWYY